MIFLMKCKKNASVSDRVIIRSRPPYSLQFVQVYYLLLEMISKHSVYILYKCIVRGLTRVACVTVRIFGTLYDNN